MIKPFPKPTQEQVEHYLRKWDSLENYVQQESSLRKLFTVTYPNNSDIDDVLIKVCSLNDFYSTNIFSPFKVAKHIVALNIDERIKQNDESLVNEIASVRMSESKTMNFYSFASKYLSHHKPLIFPIYDSYVDEVLRYLRRTDQFSKFKNEELKDYKQYKGILKEFQRIYQLENYNLKEIDKYLWQVGKEFIDKKY
jgi:hypothetical protein